MLQSMNAEYFDWNDVESFVKDLLTLCKDRAYIGVYGIPRGGLVLATILSYRLRIPLLNAPSKGCLVVDDIADSGDTLLHYDVKGYDIVTMCYKSTSKVKPMCYYKETTQWAVFPWEGGLDESK